MDEFIELSLHSLIVHCTVFAALFMHRGKVPIEITTDKLRRYGAANPQ